MKENPLSLGELLTIEELAERLKVRKSWIYARTRETGAGSLPRIKCGKYLRFSENAVAEWLRDRNEQSRAE
jgi:excisionase family DNA binding protein